MPDTMSVHKDRLRRYEMRYGREEVESWMDAAIALQEQIDPHLAPRHARHETPQPSSVAPRLPSSSPRRTPYDDLWALDDDRPAEEPPPQTEQPRDLLLFIMEHARHLTEWQRDILAIIRTEMLYFWPQLETKILNEGWATYWHARIMQHLDLTEAESIEFARMHASVLAPTGLHINPYLVGYELLRSIEKRWSRPDAPGRDGSAPDLAIEKLFEVRETETDLSLIRNYVTEELVEQLDLYVYRREGRDWIIQESDWRAVRDELVRQLTNGGVPVISVADGDYRKNGELMLKHRFEGVQLDLHYVERTLPYVHKLWGRPVHLETVVDGKTAVFSCAGGRVVRE